jgi:CubicO group peptidase (beta-lactamase class C family)
MRKRMTAGAILAMTFITASLSDGGISDPRIARLEKIFSGLASSREPGAAVLVAKAGRVVFKRGYGVTDLRTLRPISRKTNFRLASVTKQFTAAAVMLCVRDGRLGYDDRLTTIFPDFPEYGRNITIRHLLNHTSGLPDYEDLMTPAVAAFRSRPSRSRTGKCSIS